MPVDLEFCKFENPGEKQMIDITLTSHRAACSGNAGNPGRILGGLLGRARGTGADWMAGARDLNTAMAREPPVICTDRAPFVSPDPAGSNIE